MATAALQPSSGRDRFYRLETLLINGGIQIIRGLFDYIHHPSNLVNALQINLGVLNQLKARKILSQVEWNKIFPTTSSYGKSEDFDLTLLFKLLRNICNLTEPATGWDKLPRDTDICLESDIARVKHHRNETYAHIRFKIELSVEEFNCCWDQIKGALLRIAQYSAPSTVTKWEEQIDKSRTGPITEDDIRNHLSGFPVIDVTCVTKVAQAGGFVVLNVFEHFEEDAMIESLLSIIQATISPTQRVIVEDVHEGSLVIQLRVKDLDALEEFWKRYKNGELANALEKVLITEKIKKLSDKAELTVLKVTVSEDEYLHARYFLEELELYSKKEIVTAAAFESEKKVQEMTGIFGGLSLGISTPTTKSGFSKQQQQHELEYVEKHFKNNEEMKTKTLTFINENPFFLSLCSVPLTCLSVCVYMEEKLKKSSELLPITLAHLYSYVTQYIEENYNKAILNANLEKSSASMAAHKNLDKLSELAAQMIKLGVSSFDEGNLKQLNLSEEELNSLKSSSLLFQVSEHASEYRFIHPTIQEYLAACYFVKMNEIPAEIGGIRDRLVFQFMAGSMDPERDEELMNRLLKLLESAFHQESLLACLYQYAYADKEFVKKYLHNRYWGKDKIITLSDIDYNAVVMLVEIITALNQEYVQLQSQSLLQRPSGAPYYLYISDSPLTLSGAKTLFTSLSKEFCSITWLELIGCSIDDDCVECISTYLTATKIIGLDLLYNLITDKGALSIIPYCNNLRCLDLRWNKISDDCKEHLIKLVKDGYPNLMLEV